MSFIDDFNPVRGDVIYGITPARTAYKDAWWKAHMAHIDQHTPADDPHFKMMAALGWHQMDEYNNYFGIPVISNTGKASKANAHLVQKGVAVATDVGAASNVPRLQQYQASLSTSRFSPAGVFNTPGPKLAQEGYNATQYADPRNWLQKQLGHDKAKSSACQALEQSRNYLAIRRACKFGIGLVATGDEFADAIVHFVLDGLDMQEVCNKQTRQSQGSGMLAPKTFVSITVSELRYVYRNWGTLNAKVVLYVNLQPVAAPWITDWGNKNGLHNIGGVVSARKDLWDNYGAARDLKYAGAGGLPNKGMV